ncbi:hypothetical protein L2U69_08565 [Zavarzinia compransoris]|uniref:hypothetical protein n=1 Tax=Zavarzinia marina TaxID=2911065 RepID=UPI001F249BC0|nr:hypothetical protein [Zavarzinia marina]MCF4165693.1 hypothetical protein [Zavarzinia marina]
MSLAENLAPEAHSKQAHQTADAHAVSALALVPEVEADDQGGVIAPVLMGLSFLLIALFGVFLAARAPDQYGYVAGFGFMAFAFVMSMHYFARRI